MLGEERRLIPDCASAKNTPTPTAVEINTVCLFVEVFSQTQHVLWLIKLEHRNHEWLQMWRSGEDVGFFLVLTCFLTLH